MSWKLPRHTHLTNTLACAIVQLAPAVKSSNSLTSQFQDVNCVTWNPSERGLLASASDDGSVKLWQLQPWRLAEQSGFEKKSIYWNKKSIPMSSESEYLRLEWKSEDLIVIGSDSKLLNVEVSWDRLGLVSRWWPSGPCNRLNSGNCLNSGHDFWLNASWIVWLMASSIPSCS